MHASEGFNLSQTSTISLKRTDAKRGSKLDQVRQTVLAGRGIGISCILVEPEELRGYVEEKLIPLVEGWKCHSAKKRRPNTSSYSPHD